MSTRLSARASRRRQRGQALVVLVLCLMVVLGFAGLAVDAGHTYLIKRDVQNAADAAALAAGKQLYGSLQTAPPSASRPGAAQAAWAYASNNGYATTYSTSSCFTDSGSGSSETFTATWVDTGSCSTPSGANTVVTVHDPPVTAPDGTAVPVACTGTTRFNCFQVLIESKVVNYIMPVFGFNSTTVTANAVVIATPLGQVTGNPPPYAVYLYEPAPAFDGTKPASRTQLNCPEGSTESTITCPTFWTENGSPTIVGAGGGTEAAAVNSAGDLVIQGQTTICDGNYTCTKNQTQASGAQGFAVQTGSTVWCKQLNGASTGCTTSVEPALQQLWGQQVGYTTQSWAPVVDTSGLADCGSLDLILNGQSVASATSGTACAPDASSPYSIEPGRYHSIVINHGTYEFESGMYDIVGKAPVNKTGPATGCQTSTAYTANGVDHCRESNATDVDLCNTPNNAQACPDLTAGVWIGHGGGTYGAYAPPTASSCAGGTPGTDGGGGDATIVSGSAVVFRLESTSGGFVTTGDVSLVSLHSPGPDQTLPAGSVSGPSGTTGSIPMLIDEENNAYIHLDAGQPPKGPPQQFSDFSGIVYQTESATGGGVEIAADMGATGGTGSSLQGQVLAYSFTTWGNGTAVDFSQGYGSSAPPISTSGHAETSVITSPAPAVTAAVDRGGNPISGYETFTVHYADEWAMDAYDSYVRVNNGSPVFFSQNEWGPQPGSGAALPPEGSANNLNPNDSTGPPVMAAWPVYPTSQSTVTYGNGAAAAGYTAYLDSSTNVYDDWVEALGSGATTSYFETLGSWTWGHQKDISSTQTSGSYEAAIKYTFPTPAGTNLSITIFLTDGDHCGDYATASYTFANIGQPNGGSQSGGTVELIE